MITQHDSSSDSESDTIPYEEEGETGNDSEEEKELNDNTGRPE
jgi:hypothetical protein